MKVKLICEKSKYNILKEELARKGIEVVEDSKYLFIDTSSDNNQIKIVSKGEIIILNTLDIVAVESFDHDIFIYLIKDEIITRTPLKEIKLLLNDRFIQISQSVIINKNCVKKIKSAFNYRFIVYMSNGKDFTVTKSYYYKFIEEMEL